MQEKQRNSSVEECHNHKNNNKPLSNNVRTILVLYRLYCTLHFFIILNRGILNLKSDKKTFQRVLGMMLLLESISPTFTTVAWCSESNFVQFVMLYSMGAYWVLFQDCLLINKAERALVTSVIAWIGISGLGDVVGTKIPYA